MTQAAVIIHTKTRFCDYPSVPAVCPSFFKDDEIRIVHKKILAATRSIDLMNKNEERQMVYSSGKYVIAGMVSFLKNLANDNNEDEMYFRDEGDRSIFAFVGFVFPVGVINTPLITKKILWDNFKIYMEPVWQRRILDTQFSNYNEVEFNDVITSETTEEISIDDMTLYHMSFDDANVFSYWLGQALMGKTVSFCSNVTDYEVVKERIFTVITTTNNIIERVKNDSIHVDNNMIINSTLEIESSSKSKFEQKKKSIPLSTPQPPSIGKISEKNSNKLWMSILVVLFIIILLYHILK